MAINLGELYYTITANTNFKKADQRVQRFSNRVKSTFGSIARSVTSLQGSIAILAGGAGLGMLAKSFVDVTSKAEDLKIALDTITKGEGEETFRKLNQWALQMPINTEKAIDSFKQLRAMGLKPTIKDMTTLVDASSALGGGAQTFQGIARALGQISTKGKVSAEELMQLAERGVPAYQILKEQLNLTSDQVRNIGNSSIDVQKALQALMTGMEERFGGASKKIMNAWSGLMESLRSWAKEFAKFVMKSGPFQAMKESLREFLNYLESKRGQLALKQWAADTAEGVLNAFKIMTRAAGIFGKSINFIIGYFSALTQQVAEAGVSVINFFQLFGEVKKSTKRMKSSLQSIAASAKDMGVATAKNIMTLDSGFKRLESFINNAKSATDRFTNSNKEAEKSSIDLGAGIGKVNKKTDESEDKMKSAEKQMEEITKELNKVQKSSKETGDSAFEGMRKMSKGAQKARNTIKGLSREFQKMNNMSLDMGRKSSKSELDGKGLGGVPLGAPLPTTEREAREWYGGAFANDGNQAKVSTASTQSTDNMMPSIEINMSNNGLQDPQEIAGQIEEELIRRMRSGKLRRAIQDAAKGRA